MDLWGVDMHPVTFLEKNIEGLIPLIIEFPGYQVYY